MHCTYAVGVGTVGGWAGTDWRFALIFYDRAVNASRGREEEGRLLLQYRRPFLPRSGPFFPKLSLAPFPPLSASSHQIPPLPPSSLFPGRRETAKEIEDDD